MRTEDGDGGDEVQDLGVFGAPRAGGDAQHLRGGSSSPPVRQRRMVQLPEPPAEVPSFTATAYSAARRDAIIRS